MKRSTTSILKAVRALMKEQNINGYIVPSEDAHFSEYVADCDKRRAYVSGFTGSAGTALILEDEALLWTDGRYFLQAEQQLDDNWKLMRALTKDVPTLTEYVCSKRPASVGFAKDTLSLKRYKEMKASLRSAGVQLVGVDTNLVDSVWSDRPQRPVGRDLRLLTPAAVGATVAEKLAKVRDEMRKVGAGLLALTSLDDCAWLLNYRAIGVIPYSPVMFANCLLTERQATLFADLHPEVVGRFDEHLQAAGVQLRPYAEFYKQLAAMATAAEGRVWLDVHANAAAGLLVPRDRLYSANSPAAVLKAVKTPAELAGMSRAHELDAVALCQYLHWLEQKLAAGETVTELSGSDHLDGLRAKMEEFVELSFESISGAGPNGAVIHYRVTKETDRRIGANEIYLIDSGGHYECGTTDVTRTVHTGSPSQRERRHFTLVLQGHIQLAMTTFPEGVNGSRLDCVSRRSLWAAGLEFHHGTGHGVGHFLNVHEGPCAISGARSNPNEIGLKEGMVVTIEPGVYLNGHYGIRIENVVAVVRDKRIEEPFDGLNFLTFEPLTLAPISLKLVEKSMLTDAERRWLNEYHSRVRSVVGQQLADRGLDDVRQWLIKETEPI